MTFIWIFVLWMWFWGGLIQLTGIAHMSGSHKFSPYDVLLAALWPISFPAALFYDLFLGD